MENQKIHKKRAASGVVFDKTREVTLADMVGEAIRTGRHRDQLVVAYDQTQKLLQYVGVSKETATNACDRFWNTEAKKDDIQRCFYRNVPDYEIDDRCDRDVLVEALVDIWTCQVEDLADYLGINKEELA